MIETLIGIVIGVVVFVAGMVTQRAMSNPDKSVINLTRFKKDGTPVIDYDPYEEALNGKPKGVNTVE